MSLRYGVLCFFLFFIILILFSKNYGIWTLPIEVLPEKEATQKSGSKVETSLLIPGQKGPETVKSTLLISEKNIFNPERKDFPIISPLTSEQANKPTVRPIIILYGVTLGEDYQYALISNSGRPLQKGEKEIMTIKAGDRIGEYQLAKILPDRIIMEAPEDTFEVLLYDPKTPKKRISIKTETKPSTITSPLPPSGRMPAEVSRTIPSPASPSPLVPIPSPRPRIRMAPISPSPSSPMEEREEAN